MRADKTRQGKNSQGLFHDCFITQQNYFAYLYFGTVSRKSKTTKIYAIRCGQAKICCTLLRQLPFKESFLISRSDKIVTR